MQRVASPSSSTGIRKAYAGVLHTLGFGVLINAFIAGRALIGAWEIDVHGYIGNAVFVLAVAAVVLAFVGRADRVALGLTIALFVLVFAQIGLGYSGRDNLDVRPWHIANGVLLFGVMTWAAARASMVGLRADQPR